MMQICILRLQIADGQGDYVVSATDQQTKQGLVRILRHFAGKLGERPDYDPAIVEMIHTFEGFADLVESAADLPSPARLKAMISFMERAVARLP